MYLCTLNGKGMHNAQFTTTIKKNTPPSNLGTHSFSTSIPLSAIVASPTDGYPQSDIICFEKVPISTLQDFLENNATLIYSLS
jgi:hypothetical protein